MKSATTNLGHYFGSVPTSRELGLGRPEVIESGEDEEVDVPEPAGSDQPETEWAPEGKGLPEGWGCQGSRYLRVGDKLGDGVGGFQAGVVI